MVNHCAMKIGLKMLMAASLGAALVQVPCRAADEPAFPNEKEKASYAVGVWIGERILKPSNFDLNLNTTLAAIHDVMDGKPSKLTDQQVQETLRAYQLEMRQKLADKNKKAGAAFLAENKKKPGVMTKEVKLPDGKSAELQYKILNEGSGPSPGSNDVVEVKYRGTFIDGKEFDGTDRRGDKPTRFPVRGVVRGWTEALEMMKTGAKWEIYLPSDLAYGDNGNRGIEPGSTLIFDMELVGFNPPTPPPHPAQPLTSDIIKVPSAEEMKKGAKIQVLKPDEAAKLAKEQSDTNKK